MGLVQDHEDLGEHVEGGQEAGHTQQYQQLHLEVTKAAQFSQDQVKGATVTGHQLLSWGYQLALQLAWGNGGSCVNV